MLMDKITRQQTVTGYEVCKIAFANFALLSVMLPALLTFIRHLSDGVDEVVNIISNLSPHGFVQMVMFH